MAESIEDEVLDEELLEYKLTRKKRVPSRVRQKRKRYYRRNRSKIKRKQKRYRRKPRVKRLAKRRIKIRKRLHLKPGSRRRIHMSTGFQANLKEMKSLRQGESMDMDEIKKLKEEFSNESQLDLIRGFTQAIELAEGISKNFSTLIEAKIIHSKPLNEEKNILAEEASIPDELFDLDPMSLLPSENLPSHLAFSQQVDSSMLDEEFEGMLQKKVFNPANKRKLHEDQVKLTESMNIVEKDLAKLVEDANSMIRFVKMNSISTEEANDILGTMAEYLEKTMNQVSEESDEEPLIATIYIDDEKLDDGVIGQIQKVLDQNAPDWGELVVSETGGGINITGVQSASGFKFAKDSIDSIVDLLKLHGYKVNEVATGEDEEVTEAKDEDEEEEIDLHRYMEQWRDNDNFTDLNLMLDRNLQEMAADLLDGSGAIEPIDKESKELLKVAKSYKGKIKRESEKAFFRNMEVWIDKNTNEHAFLPYGDVDYFIGQLDLKSWGYEFDTGYDKNGNQYKKSTLEEHIDAPQGDDLRTKAEGDEEFTETDESFQVEIFLDISHDGTIYSSVNPIAELKSTEKGLKQKANSIVKEKTGGDTFSWYAGSDGSDGLYTSDVFTLDGFPMKQVGHYFSEDDQKAFAEDESLEFMAVMHVHASKNLGQSLGESASFEGQVIEKEGKYFVKSGKTDLMIRNQSQGPQIVGKTVSFEKDDNGEAVIMKHISESEEDYGVEVWDGEDIIFHKMGLPGPDEAVEAAQNFIAPEHLKKDLDIILLRDGDPIETKSMSDIGFDETVSEARSGPEEILFTPGDFRMGASGDSILREKMTYGNLKHLGIAIASQDGKDYSELVHRVLSGDKAADDEMWAFHEKHEGNRTEAVDLDAPIGNPSHSTETYRLAKNGMAEATPNIGAIAAELIAASRRGKTSIPALLKSDDYKHYADLESEIMSEVARQKKELQGEAADNTTVSGQKKAPTKVRLTPADKKYQELMSKKKLGDPKFKDVSDLDLADMAGLKTTKNGKFEDISEAEASLTPPNKWLSKMKARIQHSHPNYSDEQVQARASDLWFHKLSTAKKQSLSAKEESMYESIALKTKKLPNGDLEVALAKDSDAQYVDADGDFEDTFEHLLQNGMDMVAPEEIGALTDAPLIGFTNRDDHGKLEQAHEVYFFPNYAIENPSAELKEKGKVIFKNAEDKTGPSEQIESFDTWGLPTNMINENKIQFTVDSFDRFGLPLTEARGILDKSPIHTGAIIDGAMQKHKEKGGEEVDRNHHNMLWKDFDEFANKIVTKEPYLKKLLKTNPEMVRDALAHEAEDFLKAWLAKHEKKMARKAAKKEDQNFVEESSTDAESKAEALGKAAFEAGKKCKPYQDDALMKMVEGPVGSKNHLTSADKLFKAWHKGWHQENLKDEDLSYGQTPVDQAPFKLNMDKESVAEAKNPQDQAVLKYLERVAEELGDMGFIVEEPSLGYDHLDVWKKGQKKKGFIEIYLGGVDPSVEEVHYGVFTWSSGDSEEPEDHDVEVNFDDNWHDHGTISDLASELNSSFDFDVPPKGGKKAEAEGDDDEAYSDLADHMLSDETTESKEPEKCALVLKAGVTISPEKMKELGKQLNVKISVKKGKDGDVVKLDTNHASIYQHAANLIGHDKVKEIKSGQEAVHENNEEPLTHDAGGGSKGQTDHIVKKLKAAGIAHTVQDITHGEGESYPEATFRVGVKKSDHAKALQTIRGQAEDLDLDEAPNAISKLKGEHKKAVQMALQQLKDDGYAAQAKKIESGVWDLKKAGDWAEDVNYHGLASVFWNEPGVDHAAVMRGELSHRNADSGTGEEYAGERDGALDTKYDAAYGSKDDWDEKHLKSDFQGNSIKLRKLRTLIFLDHHEMTDSPTYKKAMDHVNSHKEEYSSFLKELVQGAKKSAADLESEVAGKKDWSPEDIAKVKKHYEELATKYEEAGQKLGLL